MKKLPIVQSSTEKEGSSFYNDSATSSVWGKLAHALTSDENPREIVSILGMIVSCLQIWNIFALTAVMSLPQMRSNEAWRTIIKNIGHLISFEKFLSPESEGQAIFPLVVFYIYFIIVMMSFAKVLQNQSSIYTSFFSKLLKVIATIHCSAIFYPIHFILFKITQANNLGESAILVQIFSYFLMIINCLFSFMMTLCLYIPIRTSDILSSKTNVINALDISIKVIFPFIYIVLQESGIAWIMMLIINLCYSLLRSFMHFYTLPYYQIIILQKMTIFSAVIASFSLVAIICKVLASSGVKEAGLDLLIVLWIPVCLILTRVYTTYLQKLVINILAFNSPNKNPYHIVHFWSVFKYFSLDFTKRINQSRYFSKRHLIIVAFLKELPIHLNSSKLNLHTVKEDISQEFNEHKIKNDVSNLFTKLLEQAITGNPQNLLLKATLAAAYVKSDSILLGNSIIIREFQHKKSWQYRLLYHLFRSKLQAKVNDQSSRENSEKRTDRSPDIQAFIKASQISKTLKNLIRNQLDDQIQFWKVLQMSTVNAASLIRYTHIVHRRIIEVEAHWRSYEDINSHHNFESLLVYGQYLTQIQDQAEIGNKLIKKYSDSIAREAFDVFRNAEGNQKISVSNSVWLIISGMPDELGYVIDCSSNIESKLRVDKKSVYRKSINNLMPSFFAKQHDHFMVAPLGFKIVHRNQETLILTRGHLTRSLIEISLSYFTDKGLCYFVLLEPIIDDKMIVLIREDGTIVDTSDDFERNVRGNSREASILTFCPDFERILNALRVRNKNTSINKIHQKYAQGSRLKFYPLTDDEEDEIAGCVVKIYKVKIEDFKYQDERIFKLEIEQTKPKKETTKPKKSKVPIASKIISSLSQIIEEPSPHADLVPAINLMLERDNRTSPKSSRDYDESTHRDDLGSETQRLGLMHDYKKINSRDKYNSSLINLEASIYSDHARSISPELTMREDKSFISKKPHQNFLLHKLETPRVSLKEIPNTTIDNKRASDQSQEHLKQSKDLDPNNQQKRPSFDSRRDKTISEAQEAPKKLGKEQKSGPGSIYNQSPRHHKNLNHLLSTANYSKSTRMFIVIFLFLMIAVSCFLVWFSMNTYKVSDQIAVVSNLLQRTYFKAFFTNLAHQELRFLTAGKTYFFNDPAYFSSDIIVGTFYEASTRLEKYNSELWLTVENADTHIKGWFFEKNVRILERDENNTLITVDIDNLLGATERLLSRVHFIRHEDLPETALSVPDVETRYYFDNSVNDLLVSSENIIDRLYGELQITFQRTKQNNVLIFFSSLTVLILLFISTINFAWKLRRGFIKFSHLIFTIPRDESLKIELKLSAFSKALEKPSIFECSEHSPAKNTRRSTRKDVISKERFLRELKMREVYTEMLLLLAKLVALLLIILVFLGAYYYKAQTQNELMEKQQVIIASALNNVQQQTLLSVQLQSLVFDNDTITIRNRPILDGLDGSIQRLKEVTQLQDLFKNYKGEFSPENKEILFSIKCVDAISPFYYLTPDFLLGECLTLGNGQDTISLVTLFPQMANQVTSFINAFEKTSRDYSGVKDIYNVFLYELCNPLDLTITLLLLSYSVTVAEFNELKSTLLKEGTQLLAGVLLVLLIVIAVMWFFVIKKLVMKEFERRKILALMPGGLIARNAYLKKYIIDISDQDVRKITF